ncbi:unnamed protein product [Pelagomonas calceolata]|uniref:Uncharacterized protein n=1 Tax=Pelagomonas calceolata TaxID=35677 RepID=A0A8J2S5N3_9STRA|nr:unnamed protein product [Pelagomonas calceolata]|mmetsp:Transcript_1921/g.5673  ORF Transcript_1921/g.5673 Transcript_1921/m.5673 type:complete len:243 (+) Transcript_1921:307-1035(+)
MMARRIELLLLALVSASALVAPIRRAVPRAALRSTPPESGAGASTASSDAPAGGDAGPANDAAAAPTLAEDAAAAATDAVAVADADTAATEPETADAADAAATASTKFRGADANKPKDYEDFNPDQPDIVQKFVKQRDDWWAADSPFPGAPVDKKGGDEGPIDSLAKIPVPAYLWLLTSTVGAIAFVGCIFQLFYNVPPAPVLGVPLTAAIGVTSGPAFILLFLVAIARGQREADEDDAKYM